MTTPVGTILAYCGGANPLPSQYLICDGSQLPISDYPDLSEVLSNWNNSSKPSTGNFFLPDLRGTFLRGLDNGRSLDPSTRTLGSLQESAIQDHTHSVNVRIDWPTSGTQNTPVASASADSPISTGTVNPSSANVSVETRPVNVAVNFIIKALPDV